MAFSPKILLFLACMPSTVAWVAHFFCTTSSLVLISNSSFESCLKTVWPLLECTHWRKICYFCIQWFLFFLNVGNAFIILNHTHMQTLFQLSIVHTRTLHQLATVHTLGFDFILRSRAPLLATCCPTLFQASKLQQHFHHSKDPNQLLLLLLSVLGALWVRLYGQGSRGNLEQLFQ